jgi:hypothetical protein
VLDYFEIACKEERPGHWNMLPGCAGCRLSPLEMGIPGQRGLEQQRVYIFYLQASNFLLYKNDEGRNVELHMKSFEVCHGKYSG